VSVGNPPVHQSTSVVRLLDRLWCVMSTMRLTAVLLVWLAAVIVLGVLIPQSPYHMDAPLARSQWLSSIPRQAWPLVEWLQPLGVFNLLNTAWLWLPMALLFAHALVVMAAWVPTAWRRAITPLSEPARARAEMPIPGRSFRLTILRDEPGMCTGQPIIEHLKQIGYGVLADEDVQRFTAWRWRWGWLVLVCVYAGLALTALGLILQGGLGQTHEINLEPGNVTPLPGMATINLVLDDVTAVGGNPLNPAVVSATLRTFTELGGVQSFTLGIHRSRLLHGMWLTMLDARPVVVVAVTDTQSGESLLLQPFVARAAPQERVRLPLAESPDARFAGVPSRNVTLRVDYPVASGQLAATPFSVSFFRGVETDPSFTASLKDGEETTFDGARYRVSLDYDIHTRMHVGLWWLVVAVGGAIVVLCSCLLTARQPVWVRAYAETGTKGCQVTLVVDTLADERMLRLQLQALATPDAKS
jgi:hypothetical protein